VEVLTLDGRGYAKFLAAGTYFLRKYRQVLNDLNVFPVPDGDTGTNMYLTVRSAMLEAGKLGDGAALSEVAAQAAQGSLMGARGNSGVIISQMLRGFAHHVRHRAEVDSFVVATALREGAATARRALMRPVEGTIISVADAAADAAYRLALKERDLYRFIHGVLDAANAALERTPDQLPILKQAGVVDSGGAGFVYFLEGILSFLPDVKVRATAFPRRPLRERAFAPSQLVGEHKYCTEFMLEQAAIGPRDLRDLLEPRGESLLVVGEEPTLRVHVHTDDPQRVEEIAKKYGNVTRLKVDDMERQHQLLVVDKPKSVRSIVALVPGEGFERIVRELGAEVVLSGEKNPSVRELLLSVTKCLSDDVYLFVNDRNAALAAGEAAKLSDKRVRVVPTSDIVAGVAGLFALRAMTGDSLPDPGQIMAVAAGVRRAQLFFAGKEGEFGAERLSRGQPAAIYDGALIAGQTVQDAAQRAVRAMQAGEGELTTLYYGGAQKEKDARRLAEELRAAFPGVDVEYYYGGMKNAEYWISIDA
jgi:uncharacterized protein